MHVDNAAIALTATDVANHLSCRHLTSLNLRRARGEIAEPVWDNPHAKVLAQRGKEHEAAYIAHLRAGGLTIADLSQIEGDARERTLAAMQRGEQVIVQGTLATAEWEGRADVLLRVDRPSMLGAWSYEVADCKLARETKAETILQLCLYSELLHDAQGIIPAEFHVIRPETGFEPESFRTAAFAAYYRLIKQDTRRCVADARDAYPEPVKHCEVCRWWKECDRRRRADDHLSFVAGISKLQRNELVATGVPTLAALARMDIAAGVKPARGSRESYDRIREQARLQLEQRESGQHRYELLPLEPGKGLHQLPEPNEGDIYLDIEGDLYVRNGGLEYLFGAAYREDCEWRIRRRWSLNREQEQAAYEETLAWIMSRLELYPGLHIYHYDDYEPSAFKRLLQRHAKGVEDVDRLLRGEIFVDLHKIVKQSLRASVETYSLKALEVIFGYARQQPLEPVGPAKRFLEHQLELYAAPDIPEPVKETVARYNADDCLALAPLQTWLESLRVQVIADAPRPVPKEREANQDTSAHQEKVAAMFARLTANLPSDAEEASAFHLLAHALDWHARESKVKWWEFFRMKEMDEDEVLAHNKALGGLRHLERRPKEKRSQVDRYYFPPQACLLKSGDKLKTFDEEPFGEVFTIDLANGIIDIKKAAKRVADHPTGAFTHKNPVTVEQFESLYRLAEHAVAMGLNTDERRAACDLLLRRPPRLSDGILARRPGETILEFACRIVGALNNSVLPIQGPPGSGKTYTGARMICTLLRQGKRVGVTASGHSVIHKLLLDSIDAARSDPYKVEIRCGHKDDEDQDDGIQIFASNEGARAALASGQVNVLGGTSWLWSRPEFANSVDVLFIDEAGQMSLANALAVAQAAPCIVLLGDPQQLNQVQQGSHLEGSGVSVLEHMLNGHAVIDQSRGLFLRETRRLHPALSAFTSEVFYEGRLDAHSSTRIQRIHSPARFEGAGLYYLPVHHAGNQGYSLEEVGCVAALLRLLTDGGEWTNERGIRAPLSLGDILIVAPYNEQVRHIQAAIPGAWVGTVDKLQGQQAAVVIYSLAASSPEDAPRAMEFLYNPNRFNVATSRARCAVIVVGNPRLFTPECRSPRQMELANVLCRYREMSTEIQLELHA